MAVGDLVVLAFMTFWSGAISALVWGTYRRLDHRMDRFDERLDNQISGVRAEIGTLRAEIGTQIGSLRGEMTGLRADLTQVALAVGARRPRATEG